MSLKKKLRKELEGVNCEICIDNTEFNKSYYIYMWKDKNKLNGFNFYYDNNYNFKLNVQKLRILCIIYFKFKVFKCYKENKLVFLTEEQHEICKSNSCYYKKLCSEVK